MFTFPNAIIDPATGHIIVQTPAPPYAYLQFDGAFTEVACYQDFFKAFADTKAMDAVRAVAGTGGGAIAALLCVLNVEAALRDQLLQNPLFHPIDDSGWLGGFSTSWIAANLRDQALETLLDQFLYTVSGESTLTLGDLANSHAGIHAYFGVGERVISHETHPEMTVRDAVRDAVLQPASKASPFYRWFDERGRLPQGFNFNENGQNPAVLHVPLRETLTWLKQHYDEALSVTIYPTRLAWLDSITLDEFVSLLREYETLNPVPHAYLDELKAYFAWRCNGGADPAGLRPELTLPHVNCPPMVVGGEWNEVVRAGLIARHKTVNAEIKRMQETTKAILRRMPPMTIEGGLHHDAWFSSLERYVGYQANIKMLREERVLLRLWLGLKSSIAVQKERYQPTPQVEIQAILSGMRASLGASPVQQAILSSGYPEFVIKSSPHFIGLNAKYDYRHPEELKCIVLAAALMLRHREPASLPVWMPMVHLIFGEQATLPMDLPSLFALLGHRELRESFVAATQIELLLNEFLRLENPNQPAYLTLETALTQVVPPVDKQPPEGTEMKHVISRMGLFGVDDAEPIAVSPFRAPATRI